MLDVVHASPHRLGYAEKICFSEVILSEGVKIRGHFQGQSSVHSMCICVCTPQFHDLAQTPYLEVCRPMGYTPLHPSPHSLIYCTLLPCIMLKLAGAQAVLPTHQCFHSTPTCKSLPHIVVIVTLMLNLQHNHY